MNILPRDEILPAMLEVYVNAIYYAVDLLVAQPALIVVTLVTATLALITRYHPKDD